MNHSPEATKILGLSVEKPLVSKRNTQAISGNMGDGFTLSLMSQYTFLI